MRKIYWYLTAYFKKHGATLIMSVIGAIVIFSVLIPLLAEKITIKKRTYIGLVGEYTLNSLPSEIKNKLSVGLTTVDPTDQSIKPLLAERWVTEDEGKTYRFVLKKGLKWQDGQDLIPADINYNFNDVETISTQNDLVFKLPDQFSPFPSVLTEPVFRPAETKVFFFFRRPTLIGIGPYQIANYQLKNKRLTEIALDNQTERLIYRFYLTEKDCLTAFQKGEVDLINDLADPSPVADWPQIKISPQINYQQYLAVFFNNSHPLLTKNVRQALSYSVAKPATEIRALGPISEKNWAYLAGTKSYQKDLSRAIERLLDEPPSTPIELTLTTTAIYEAEAKQYRDEWQDLGQQAAAACQNSSEIKDKSFCPNLAIKINLKITNFPDPQNFELLLVGQEIPTDPDQYFLWHSDQSTNFTHYQNTRIDSLLEKGRKTLNQQERITAYQEFQQFLLEDPPAIFLNYLVSYQVER